jgi:aspartate 1-decarboxylase
LFDAGQAAPGDMLIIATYAVYNEMELQRYKPEKVYVDSRNRIKADKAHVPAQSA